jgi:hypothetical protein
MERLTKKEKKVVILNNRNIGKNFLTIKQYEKLQELENLEEELGIDLITLFRALKENIYYNDCGRIIKVVVLDISTMRENKFCLECYYDFKKFRVDTRDYGKTWFLDRSELEND